LEAAAVCLTVWCILVVLAGLIWVGVPARWLLGRRRPLDEGGWLEAPFIGLAVVVLLSQNLVYLGWPVACTAWLPWALGLLFWIWFFRSGTLRASLAGLPGRLFAVAGAVYLLHGLGLLMIGARYYAGRGWSDQVYYAALGHLFRHFPFPMGMEEVGLRPCLALAVPLEFDRIGQSVLHAFLAASSGTSAKTMFEPLILTSPALTVLAAYALARRLGLGARQALGTAAAAGLLPAVAALHLEGFLSHALGLPFLLLFPAALADLHARPGPPALSRASLLLAAAVAVYTEFVPLFGMLLVVSLAVLLLRRPRRWLPAAGHLVLAAAPILLNPGFFRPLLVVLGRVQAPGACADTYPWALSVEGWARLWLGDLAVAGPAPWVSLARFFAVTAAGLGYLGLVRAWQAARRDAGADAAGRLVVASSAAALALVPLLLIARDTRHPYQVYKLLLSTAPLLPLGLSLLAAGGGWKRLAALAPLTAMLLAGAAGTLHMALDTCSGRPHDRSNAALMHGAELRRLQEALERRGPRRDVVITLGHPYVAAWLSYLARRHRVHLAGSAPPDPNLSGEVLVITARQGAFARVEAGDMWRLHSGEWSELWQADSRRWAVPLDVGNPNGLEVLNGLPFFWVGGPPTRLEMLAGTPGELILSARFRPGPGMPESAPLRLLVRTSAGHEQHVETAAGEHRLAVPLPAGRTTISLQALDPPAPPAPGQADLRPMVLGVQGLALTFVPGPAGEPPATASNGMEG
jgi:hypothetical protein